MAKLPYLDASVLAFVSVYLCSEESLSRVHDPILSSQLAMSTTDSTTTPTGLPTESSSPTSSSNQLASGTNYFFGFLIAFIAFLFVFLSLGLLARRRRIRLMQDFLLYGPDDDHSPAISQTEPLMWEPVYADAKRPVWTDIMVRFFSVSVSVAYSGADRAAAAAFDHAPPPRRNRRKGVIGSAARTSDAQPVCRVLWFPRDEAAQAVGSAKNAGHGGDEHRCHDHHAHAARHTRGRRASRVPDWHNADPMDGRDPGGPNNGRERRRVAVTQ